nr:MAG TPA: Protein of unknown function (DUF1666) [Bacteriophage sp.]
MGLFDKIVKNLTNGYSQLRRDFQQFQHSFQHLLSRGNFHVSTLYQSTGYRPENYRSNSNSALR